MKYEEELIENNGATGRGRGMREGTEGGGKGELKEWMKEGDREWKRLKLI